MQLHDIREWAPNDSRDRFISPKEVSRMAQMIEQENVRLHTEDAISVRLWADRLKNDNVNIFIKDKLDSSPVGSTLDEDTFVLCIQTPFQLEAFQCLGNRFIGIDTTHNVTQYQDFLLFTIVARDIWGHGMLSRLRKVGVAC